MNPQQEFYLNQIRDIYDDGREGKAAVIAITALGLGLTVGLGVLIWWLSTCA